MYCVGENGKFTVERKNTLLSFRAGFVHINQSVERNICVCV